MLLNRESGESRFVKQLYVVDRTVEQFGHECHSLDEIRKLIWDEQSLDPDKTNARKRMGEFFAYWLESGLWSVSGDGVVKNPEYGSGTLGFRLSKYIFSSSTETQLFLSTETEAVIRAMSVVMTIDGHTPFTLDPISRGELEVYVKDSLPKSSRQIIGKYRPPALQKERDLGMSSQDRFGCLIDWMEVLGILVPWNGGWFVHPEEFLSPWFAVVANSEGKDNEIMAEAFFSKLADLVPVVDGGRYRQIIEEVMEPGGFVINPKYSISASLSSVLVSMSHKKKIEYRRDSDDGNAFVLQHKKNKSSGQFSRLRLINV